jgi:hypothetical protein
VLSTLIELEIQVVFFVVQVSLATFRHTIETGQKKRL